MEIERAQLFRFERDRTAFLARRGFLRRVLGRHCALDPAELSMETGPHGKPFLGDAPGLCFNSSHSADLFLIALAWDRELGVDVQHHTLNESALVLAKGVFTPAECAELEGAPEQSQERLFFRGWTRKEAALKALGTGFMQEARQLHVGLGQPACESSPWAVEQEPKLAEQRLLDLPAPKGFSAALCVQGSGWRLSTFELPA